MAGDPFPYHGLPGSYVNFAITPTPSPRVLPVNLPFSTFGVTIAVMDRDGNLTIKVDQPEDD